MALNESVHICAGDWNGAPRTNTSEGTAQFHRMSDKRRSANKTEPRRQTLHANGFQTRANHGSEPQPMALGRSHVPRRPLESRESRGPWRGVISPWVRFTELMNFGVLTRQKPSVH